MTPEQFAELMLVLVSIKSLLECLSSIAVFFALYKIFGFGK